MNLLSLLYNKIFYQPLFNALILIYAFVSGKSFGIAVIFLTLLVKAALYPLNRKSIKSQKLISDLEPKIKEIREKFKNNQESIARETLQLYKESEVNPFSNLILVFIQIVIKYKDI